LLVTLSVDARPLMLIIDLQHGRVLSRLRLARDRAALRRPRRSGRASVLLFTAAGCALVLVLAGCGRSSEMSRTAARQRSVSMRRFAGVRPSAGPTYALLQMNLCLSGLAGCYGKTEYPAVVDEAVARIRELHPDAVTVNEGCEGDVARIARGTGYHLRFSSLIYFVGEPLTCVRPGGRGLFGDAILTAAAIDKTQHRNFGTEPAVEERQWLCVTTRKGVDVCTAHLSTRSSVEVADNDGQCIELEALLARRAATRTVIFGGDVNRLGSCAPDGLWTLTDGSATQDPGLQQVYGSGALHSPSAEVVPARHTDHDFLLVRAHLVAHG
jgi:hypothetical protein